MSSESSILIPCTLKSVLLLKSKWLLVSLSISLNSSANGITTSNGSAKTLANLPGFESSNVSTTAKG